MKQPLILITNDDGYRATGLRMLAEHLAELGRILVVAPQGPQSAVSHTITLHKPLRLNQIADGWYACSGTPTDCVYLGIHALCHTYKPSLVVSGINRGPNLGDDVFYSGTVAGAMEGLLLGYPAMAVSQAMPVETEFGAEGGIDYAPAARLARRIATEVLARGMPPAVLFNINVPAGYDERSGVRLVRLGRRLYGEAYSRRRDPRGRPYYWIGGADVGFEPVPGTDVTELDRGYATLTPVSVDLTHDGVLAELESWDLARHPAPPGGRDDTEGG
jgi:5'-nucleotidase